MCLCVCLLEGLFFVLFSLCFANVSVPSGSFSGVAEGWWQCVRLHLGAVKVTLLDLALTLHVERSEASGGPQQSLGVCASAALVGRMWSPSGMACGRQPVSGVSTPSREVHS